MKRKRITFQNLQRLIRGYGYNSVKLEAVLPYSRPTCNKRIKEPNLLTLGDLALLLRNTDITADELFTSIRKDIER